MSHIEARYQVDIHKIVIFGAGKIGRSFIGQLFGMGGYKLVFVDINPGIIKMLNDRKNYRIIIKREGEGEEEIIISNVEAISASDSQKVAEAVSTAGILAVSVGKNAIENVIPEIAAGLVLRYERNPGYPLDIIIAENMREAGEFMKARLIKRLPPDYPVGKQVGLIETSIGKMVPIMTQAELEKDPLMIFAEPYNTLILDRKGFKSAIPDIKGLAPRDNIKAWVDRKAFIHNLGHTTAAYYGNFKHPESEYIYEVLDDEEVFRFTREVMLQSARTLQVAYKNDFTFNDLEGHIDDLLMRFRNKALKDTIYRVGHDLIRKLGSDDRFQGAIHLADQYGTPYDKILKAMSYGLFFRGKDEKGNMFPADIEFQNLLSEDSDAALKDLLGLDPVTDHSIIEELKTRHCELKYEIS